MNSDAARFVVAFNVRGQWDWQAQRARAAALQRPGIAPGSSTAPKPAYSSIRVRRATLDALRALERRIRELHPGWRSSWGKISLDELLDRIAGGDVAALEGKPAAPAAKRRRPMHAKARSPKSMHAPRSKKPARAARRGAGRKGRT